MTLVVLTGATRGIGQAAAVELAKRGADVALVGRDRARVRETAELARRAGGAVHEHVADLASLAEVRRLGDELRSAYPRIDVLANNAGAIFTGKRDTPDGLEQARSGPARRYSMSKLCNVLFTRELQRRAPEVTAICFHPGVIRSGFGKNGGALARISMTVAGPFMSAPEKGGALLTWLALDPAAGDLGGEYIEKYKPVAPSKTAQDDALGRALWERSAELAGVG